jgi:D-aminopeptidase
MNQRNLWPDAIVSDAKSSMDNLDLENLRERFL